MCFWLSGDPILNKLVNAVELKIFCVKMLLSVENLSEQRKINQHLSTFSGLWILALQRIIKAMMFIPVTLLTNYLGSLFRLCSGTSSAHPNSACSHQSTRWSASAFRLRVRPRPRRANGWRWECRHWLTAPAAHPSAPSAQWPPASVAGPAAPAWWGRQIFLGV